jgi:hypothetical protein
VSEFNNNSGILITTKNETPFNSIIDFDSSEDICEVDNQDNLEDKIKSHTLSSNTLKNYKALRCNRKPSLFNSKDL